MGAVVTANTGGFDPASVKSTILMIGLAHSGKTTYMAALWHAVRNPDRTGSLTLERLPDDLEFFNALVDDWLTCKEAAHTSLAAVSRPTLALRTAGGEVAEVTMPDYSGEFVREAWVNCRWPGEMEAFVRTARALLLFVHPDFIRERVTVAEANKNAEALAGGPPDPTRAPEPFDLDLVPTQTQLIEFIQFARSRASKKPLPVAVLISAWDIAMIEQRTPREWLAVHMPLLFQFLATNSETLPSALFGVSAQGGSWPAKRDELLEQDPEHRAFVVEMDGTRRADIAIPIAWALTAS